MIAFFCFWSAYLFIGAVIANAFARETEWLGEDCPEARILGVIILVIAWPIAGIALYFITR
jgi:hypothetical protein